ncbi:unnamed protein product, partial [Vitis vinifera]
MGSRGRPLFDLNEPPAEDEEENDGVFSFQPQKALPSLNSHTPDLFSTSSGLGIRIQTVEREEGEWSDDESSANVYGSSIFESTKEENNSHASVTLDPDTHDQRSNSSRNSEGNGKGDVGPMDGQEEPGLVPKLKEVKGVEASFAVKCANNPGKKHKLDQHKEAMLGKKRTRQTVFLNLEDVKQAGPMKTSTPRRQNFPAPITTRIVKEIRSVPPPAERIGEKQNHSMIKDQKQVDLSSNEGGGGNLVESNEPKSESNNDMNSGLLGRPRRLNSANDISAEVHPPTIPRQSSWKPTDSRQFKNSQFSGRKPSMINQSESKLVNKKHPPAKMQTTVSSQYQDTSVERLIREVTNEKFWHHPEETELQCVPGRFESVEEYIRVFEPLLFEECRAQLYSTWEELTETVSRDLHAMVRIKSIERRERGWYDVIVLPANECKWTFKEGDVAILSAPRPGSVRSKRNNTSSIEDDEEAEISGRVAGTVRRHNPIDTRDPVGAILHFYVGDSYDPNSKVDDHILRKLHPKGIWYLTVLGSLATTQREYIALHAFRRLNLQMQTAILHPSPEHFPKYEEQPPAMPECFTPNFVEYLHKTFNGPQLAAIQWAAMHTAAGTSSGVTKRQDPWPFTLVQGPPGTGKTHTVWGMLNSTSDNVSMGSIDEVLQSMDQNLFRTLPKLCPKPRMLVCAPSNAATDELLARVLDRGFIDGEMKVYRPDVARVGILVEMNRLVILESRFRSGSNFNLEEARANLEASFANEAEIVFTTVSSSGRKLFSRLTHGFDMVVIDEAAQASEVAVLPPLSLGAARCVLVGDPQQLPATVISKAAGTLLYSRSLFERFQQAGCPTMLLSVQYRMHPHIRDFPSRYFYQGRLTDSESVTNLPDEAYYKDPLLRPYVFYDITHGRESHRGGSVSYQNIHEAQICLRLYEHLQKTLKSLGMGKISVGIITPYKLQLKCLQREFDDVLSSEEGKDLYINTVDAFQGQERDVIIMSCVRASSHGVGFVADIRRMNVALTRARRALWVMGNANALMQSDDWAALISDARARSCYLDMDSLPKEFLVPKGPTYGPLSVRNSVRR